MNQERRQVQNHKANKSLQKEEYPNSTQGLFTTTENDYICVNDFCMLTKQTCNKAKMLQ